MPLERIADILAEIGAIARNPRVVQLADELATEIARQFATTEARVARVIDSTTYAVTDISETLHDDIRDLRKALHTLSEDLRDHKDTVSGRVHTLANHTAALEYKLDELAEAIDQIYTFVDNAPVAPLVSPYDGTTAIILVRQAESGSTTSSDNDGST